MADVISAPADLLFDYIKSVIFAAGKTCGKATGHAPDSATDVKHFRIVIKAAKFTEVSKEFI
ncbi:hypothetical protein ASD64_09545 [Mesorhizobium sp. Root157]|nr:hypothetical protein ASD64_09545 [Mesorhizobium sp. Root157]